MCTVFMPTCFCTRNSKQTGIFNSDKFSRFCFSFIFIITSLWQFVSNIDCCSTGWDLNGTKKTKTTSWRRISLGVMLPSRSDAFTSSSSCHRVPGVTLGVGWVTGGNGVAMSGSNWGGAASEWQGEPRRLWRPCRYWGVNSSDTELLPSLCRLSFPSCRQYSWYRGTAAQGKKDTLHCGHLIIKRKKKVNLQNLMYFDWNVTFGTSSSAWSLDFISRAHLAASIEIMK